MSPYCSLELVLICHVNMLIINYVVKFVMNVSALRVGFFFFLVSLVASLARMKSRDVCNQVLKPNCFTPCCFIEVMLVI